MRIRAHLDRPSLVLGLVKQLNGLGSFACRTEQHSPVTLTCSIGRLGDVRTNDRARLAKHVLKIHPCRLPRQTAHEHFAPVGRRHCRTAAARLLNRNYKMLGTWPMAISAYNHGHAKWAKLKPAQWSALPRILSQCSKSRVPFKLGFASRNYYPEFLALLRAYRYQDVAYGSAPERKLAPVRFVRLSSPSTVASLAKQHVLPESVLRMLNPDIKVANAVLPAGFWLSLPSVEDDFSGLVQAKRRMAKQMMPSKTRVAEDLSRLTPRG